MKPSLKICAVLAFCAAAIVTPCSAFAQSVSTAIHALAVQAAQSRTPPTGPYDERGWLDRFYAPRR